MPTWAVHDPQDPRLSAFCDLRERGRPRTIVVEGEIAVARALDSEHPVQALLTTAAHRQRLGERIPASLPVYEAEASLLRQVVGFDFHRGCLAVMPRPVAQLPPWLGGRAGPRRVLVAEGLADPANLGAVIRNARALGVQALLHGRGADPWSRRAIRAAMGLGFSMPVIDCDDLVAEVQRLRAALGPGTRTVAAVVGPQARSLSEYRAAPRTVVLVGNEGQGLSAPLRALADDAVTIALAPGVDSLNVAAATAVLLWALRV